jgi:hydrogenase maturation protease
VTDRPGVRLLALGAGADLLVLVDAARSGAPPGTLHRFDEEALGGTSPLLSAHGFGVASTLALGRALGILPARVVAYGVEIADSTAAPGGALTAQVESAVGRAAAALAVEIRSHLAAGERQ